MRRRRYRQSRNAPEPFFISRTQNTTTLHSTHTHTHAHQYTQHDMHSTALHTAHDTHSTTHSTERMDSSFSSLLCTNAISRTATQQTVCAVAIIHHSANGMSKYSTTWYLQVHKVDTRRRGSGGERKKRKKRKKKERRRGGVADT